MFTIDIVYSAGIVTKLRAFAKKNDIIIKYENLKAHIRKTTSDLPRKRTSCCRSSRISRFPSTSKTHTAPSSRSVHGVNKNHCFLSSGKQFCEKYPPGLAERLFVY